MNAVGRAPVPRAVDVRLPGGWWRGEGDTSPLRELPLRAVSDEDRAYLLQTMDTATLAERANGLLARCTGIDDCAHALTVGDREVLLLNLHRLTFGETLDCVLRCPAPACAQPMELAPRVADLALPPYQDVRREFDLAMEIDGADFRASFRLPVTSDLEHIAGLALRDVEGAALELLRRCVRTSLRDDARIGADELPAKFRDAVAQEMLRLDPQAEIELAVDCANCGTPIAVVLDAASFLLQELDAQAARLLREVHVLASQYGWSEHEILGMPAPRRARYLDLIAESQQRTRSR